MKRIAIFLSLAICSLQAAARGDCYKARIIDPPVFQGDSYEYVRLFDDTVWEIEMSREVLGLQYPMATICPKQHLMIVDGVKFRVRPVPME